MAWERKQLLIVLQNPWRKGRLRGGWSPGAWRREFLSSRSGVRLRSVLPEQGHAQQWDVHYANACPTLAKDADGAFEPCLPHLRRALKRVQPDVVMACGALAEQACAAAWDGPLVCVPHPAYRLVTTALYEAAREIVVNWGIFEEMPAWRAGFQKNPLAAAATARPRLALRQRRGRYEVVELGEG
jgi:hypothetical protein